ncbi:MAG: hypothetical protein ACK518_03665 [bacterium]|jgi:uncharacterized membrane protein YjjP (DUF1212 family)
MDIVYLIQSLGDPTFENVDRNFIVKDMKSGKIYIGNEGENLSEIKTDNSNNWAKKFFYGGD